MIRKLRTAQEEEGFTLIELLVVVIIIGILAAIAIPTFLNQREAGWQAAIVSDTRNAALEVEADITSNAGTVPIEADGEAVVDGMGTTFAEGDLDYVTDGTDWCVVGTDTRLGNGPFVYDSTANGMQDPGVACTVVP